MFNTTINVPVESVQHMVAKGNPYDGFFFYGPFETYEAADEWAEAGDGDWTVIPLIKPD